MQCRTHHHFTHTHTMAAFEDIPALVSDDDDDDDTAIRVITPERKRQQEKRFWLNLCGITFKLHTEPVTIKDSLKVYIRDDKTSPFVDKICVGSVEVDGATTQIKWGENTIVLQTNIEPPVGSFCLGCDLTHNLVRIEDSDVYCVECIRLNKSAILS